MQGTNIHFRMNNFVQPRRILSNKPVVERIVESSLTNIVNISSKETVVNPDIDPVVYPQDKTNNPNIDVEKNIETTSRIIVNDDYDTPESSDTSSDELSEPKCSSKAKTNTIYDSDDYDDIVNPDFEDDEEYNDKEYSHTYNNRRQLYK